MPTLPSEKSIKAWNTSQDYNPGVITKVLDYLKDLGEQELKKAKNLAYNLVFDEVAIKARCYYNRQTHKFEGCVEYGGDLPEPNVEDETKNDAVAKKALVFMLVSLNSNFKTPVAYYLCDSLDGPQKNTLILNLLAKFHEYNIDLTSITCDGDKSNATACKLLGCNFNYYNDKENFRPFFENPYTKKIIYIFFDAVHMIKLIRNYFSARKVFFVNGDFEIKWHFIEDLHEQQEKAGLHCACKIRRRHVYFKREKMKVFLATQLLSRSTAKALEFLRSDLKDARFHGTEHTQEFVQNMNDIFDMTNVKNRFCKREGKEPITAENLTAMEEKAEKYIKYIESLQILVPVGRKKRVGKFASMNKENVSSNIVIPRQKKIANAKTGQEQIVYLKKSVLNNIHTQVGFTGMIICLKNIINLSRDLLEKKYLNYILTYKLSQDFLEMFFAIIRRMGGFNNNPTTIQFKAAFKKLLINKTCVLVPAGANCTPQDCTLLLSDGLDMENHDDLLFGISKKYYFKKPKSKKQPPKKKEKLPKIMTFKYDKFLGADYKDYYEFEHNYFSQEYWIPSDYAVEVVKYIAGGVYYSLKKIVHCQSCLDLIDGSENCEQAKLTLLRNKGGLSFASPAVEYIC